MAGRPYPVRLWSAPNIILDAPRKLDDDVMDAAFGSADFHPWLDHMHVFQIADPRIAASNPRGIMDRLIPMLVARGKRIAIEPAGLYGYQPPDVTALDVGTSHGQKGAALDLATYLAPIRAYPGARVHAVTMQDPIERVTIRGTRASNAAHKAYKATALAGTDDDLLYTAATAGAAGNSIRVQYVVAGLSTALSVSVAGNDITVNVATNGAGAATSTATQVAAAVAASGPAAALVDVVLATGNTGAGVVTAMGWMTLLYGDGGAQFTESQTSDALVGYAVDMKAGSPGTLLGIKVSPLLPFDGRAGYAATLSPWATYQMPDLRDILDVALPAARAAGAPFDYLTIDWPETHGRERVETPWAAEDDFMARMWDIRDYAHEHGLQAGVYQHSMWGENDPAYQAMTTPVPPFAASDRRWVLETVRHVREMRHFRTVTRRGAGEFDFWIIEHWFTYPRELV